MTNCCVCCIPIHKRFQDTSIFAPCNTDEQAMIFITKHEYHSLFRLYFVPYMHNADVVIAVPTAGFLVTSLQTLCEKSDLCPLDTRHQKDFTRFSKVNTSLHCHAGHTSCCRQPTTANIYCPVPKQYRDFLSFQQIYSQQP